MSKQQILDSFRNTEKLLHDFMSIEANLVVLEKVSETLADIYAKGGKVIVFGNGGSACDAMHFAEEFTGRFRKDRKPLPAIALTDVAHITCVGNDYGFDEIFSRGVEAYAQPGDLVIGISTSGNSVNVIKAIQKAKEMNCITFALLGKDGGKLKSMCNFNLVITGETSDRIQEIHMTILHIIIEIVERKLFPSLYT
jgi:D-sedoheptulose 7-phosphate isomerase